MANNVICPKTQGGCGWKGERFRMGKLTPEQQATLRWFSPEWLAACARADEQVRTIDPCPRCGGKVQLINPTQEVER